MPINTNLLIAAPMLQDYLVDDVSGLPLSAGVVTMYHDNARTILKNWYYQSGSPGAYTYITLPNPMTLSSVGTIVDNNGNDTIPFYYPYSESDDTLADPYYVTVDNSNGQRQFVRQNFPFIPESGTPGSEVETLDSYVLNNTFWNNIGTANFTSGGAASTFVFNGVTFYYQTIAPSNHDGFSYPDIIFAKNSNDAVDTITFPKFPLGSEVLQNTLTPEYYMNVQCTSAGSDTSKYVSFPISLHIQNLSGAGATLVFWAQNAGGSNNVLIPAIMQYLGSGVISPTPIPLQTIPLTNSWQQYTIQFAFPSALGAVIAGSPADDAYYLLFEFPTSETFNINIAKPELYLGTTVATNSFETYDQVDAIVNSPRTGDVRTSLNAFVPFGWVPANDGTIGDAKSNATTYGGNNTFPLYNLLWNIADAYDSGSNSNPICQMYTSAGAATNFGSTAIGDYNAHKALALTRQFGKVMLGTIPLDEMLSNQSTTFTASSSGGLAITAANNVSYFNGMPIVFSTVTGTLPTGVVANAVYYVANFNGTTAFNVATSFANALAGTVISYTNAGTAPNIVSAAIVGSSEGEYAHTQLSAELAAHTHPPLSPATSYVMNSSGGSGLSGSGGVNVGFATTGSSGSSSPFNVTQPGTFLNIYFKL